MNYADLSLSGVVAAIHEIGEDARITFGALDQRQLNWRPDDTQWSVAQCFEHLVTGNRLVVDAAKSALRNPATSVWQRLPLWPGRFGKLMIRSQGPRSPSGRRYTAPAIARPTSNVSGDIIQRFVAQHREIAAWARQLDEGTASQTIMISPFVKVITYSVLDGLRLLVAHDRRHFEQARRVLTAQHGGGET
jgi:hypothetical protein